MTVQMNAEYDEKPMFELAPNKGKALKEKKLMLSEKDTRIAELRKWSKQFFAQHSVRELSWVPHVPGTKSDFDMLLSVRGKSIERHSLLVADSEAKKYDVVIRPDLLSRITEHDIIKIRAVKDM